MEEWVLIDLLIILVLICFSGFFSGSETALTAISRARLFHLLQAGDKAAHRVATLREKKESLIGAILLGNNLVNIAAASIGTTLAIHTFGDEWGPLYATIIITLFVLIFAEVLPKTIAINNAERVSLLVSRPLSICVSVFAPITKLVQHFIAGILKLFGVDYANSSSFISANEAIRGTIELHHSEGEVEKEDRDMLGSILDLSEREVVEVMVHRKNVYAIDMAEEPEAIIEFAINSVHSRIPLFQDNPDNIIGVLHVKDVLKLVTTNKIGLTREMIRRIASKPWFVPETTALDSQLYAFRQFRRHFACVVDEYGAFQGIVTLEDIIEEIVGEIDDEHDQLEISNIMPFGESGYHVEGIVTIRDLNRHLDWNLPDDNATTVAGLIMHEAEQIPEPGSVFEFYDMRFTIIDREANQLTRILIEPLLRDEDQDDE
ncbi:MAG: HlyC/CorC family transporter [Rickettsiales bacterium]|nr:HlyC/CorC family transporter [Rickettsiales bacterium]